MINGFEISDVPEGLLIPVVAAFGIVGNLGNPPKLRNQEKLFNLITN